MRISSVLPVARYLTIVGVELPRGVRLQMGAALPCSWWPRSITSVSIEGPLRLNDCGSVVSGMCYVMMRIDYDGRGPTRSVPRCSLLYMRGMIVLPVARFLTRYVISCKWSVP